MSAKPDFSAEFSSPASYSDAEKEKITLRYQGMNEGLGHSLSASQFSPQLSAPLLSRVSAYMGYQKNSNLTDKDLKTADLRWQNLRGSNFSNIDLSHTRLWGCCLTLVNFGNANLTGADLTGADLMGADLEEACVKNACFVGARYDKATKFPKGFGSPDDHGMLYHDELMGNDSDFGF